MVHAVPCRRRAGEDGGPVGERYGRLRDPHVVRLSTVVRPGANFSPRPALMASLSVFGVIPSNAYEHRVLHRAEACHVRFTG